MIEIVFASAADKPGTYHPMLGERKLTKATRQPFFDGARALLAMGMDPGLPLAGRHEWSAIVALRSTIGEAARWAISESDRGGLRKRLWKPFPSRSGDAGTAEEGPLAI